jgi:hypothetical protein
MTGPDLNEPGIIVPDLAEWDPGTEGRHGNGDDTDPRARFTPAEA